MKKAIRSNSILLPAIFFLFLIIDSEAAVQGAAEGITQCLHVIIPSLFPFFFVTCWFNSKLLGFPLSFHLLPKKLLLLPNGCESILLTGLLGGYPVGAKTIADACDRKVITKETAHILLGFCNNAGPAFIFGICHVLFSARWIPWVIWGIQILSAIMTGLLLPRPSEATSHRYHVADQSLTSALRKSISITAIVCGWILLFKILLQILSQISFIKSALPFVAGIMELSNGCLMLAEMVPLSFRFLLFSVFLSAGGLCVYLQTVSATASIGTGLYFPGKCIQTSVCALISIPVSLLLFHELPIPVSVLLPVVCFCIVLILLVSVKYRKISGNYECDRV